MEINERENMNKWQYTDSYAKVLNAKALGLEVVFAGQVWKIRVPAVG